MIEFFGEKSFQSSTVNYFCKKTWILERVLNTSLIEKITFSLQFSNLVLLETTS